MCESEGGGGGGGGGGVCFLRGSFWIKEIRMEEGLAVLDMPKK